MATSPFNSSHSRWNCHGDLRAYNQNGLLPESSPVHRSGEPYPSSKSRWLRLRSPHTCGRHMSDLNRSIVVAGGIILVHRQRRNTGIIHCNLRSTVRSAPAIRACPCEVRHEASKTVASFPELLLGLELVQQGHGLGDSLLPGPHLHREPHLAESYYT